MCSHAITNYCINFLEWLSKKFESCFIEVWWPVPFDKTSEMSVSCLTRLIKIKKPLVISRRFQGLWINNYSTVKSLNFPGTRKNAAFLLLYRGVDCSDVTNFETGPWSWQIDHNLWNPLRHVQMLQSISQSVSQSVSQSINQSSIYCIHLSSNELTSLFKICTITCKHNIYLKRENLKKFKWVNELYHTCVETTKATLVYIY